jgi:hypothetical protein
VLQLPEPVQLVHHIMKDLEATKKQKSRFLLRLLPIESTCKVRIKESRAAGFVYVSLIVGVAHFVVSYAILFHCSP